MSTRRTLVVISQVYVPDPASVGQHMADAAAECARRGWRVVVYTSAQGYDDPSQQYPRHEERDGVEIRRIGFSSFGKGSIATRLLGGILFLLQAVVRALVVGRVDAVLVSTAPPMAGIAGWLLALLKRAKVIWWVMDLNPDQMVALGYVTPTALPVRVFDWINRRTIASARTVVVLDRFMAERVRRKRRPVEESIIPPWPLDAHLRPVAHAENEWRRAHGLDGKFVVMYSGNHGPSNPISTVLAAAERLQDDPRFAFLFVGGGVGKKEVEASTARNVVSLPYQPLDTLAYSLSAADLHVVTLGDDVVGIVHPCKVYGAMAVGRPVLLLGPAESHVGDMFALAPFGWRVAHGDVDGAVRILQELADGRHGTIDEIGGHGLALVRSRFSKSHLCGSLADIIDRAAA